jgi:hypothetical protein
MHCCLEVLLSIWSSSPRLLSRHAFSVDRRTLTIHSTASISIPPCTNQGVAKSMYTSSLQGPNPHPSESPIIPPYLDTSPDRTFLEHMSGSIGASACFIPPSIQLHLH